MEIINENLQRLTISKDLTVGLDNGKELIINKSLYEEGGNISESDWDLIDPGDKETYDNLTEDEKDQLKDLINDYDLLTNL